ncbi:hypothetical protein EIP86_003955 [Pleurotus ostreatoroseus]|nr:hypothetical protein EIP86_003955 [Pleurotus ostreatoroseus]
MFPYSFNPYGAPSYSASDAEYLRALAEEQAARQAYQDAIRAQADARARAARARRQRQAYERPHSAYLSDEDEDDGYGYGYYPRSGSAYGVPPQRAFFEEQRRRELEQRRRQEALEFERTRERERIRQLEEEQHRRMLEEERRRRMLLEEELRRQKEAEDRDQEMRRRLQDEYRRRQSVSPLEQLFGLRPSRSMQPELPHAHRARTTSPPSVRRAPSAQPTTIPVHVPVNRTPSPQRTPSPGKRAHSPSPAPARQSPPPKAATPPPTPAQVDAAKKIQSTWRSHAQRRKALASIARIAAAFQTSKTAFTLPATLDYQRAGSDISRYTSVPTTGVALAPIAESETEDEQRAQVPKLAYTPTNAPVHVYEEELNRMLTQLDEVQSGGDAQVRGRRRELARRIEREAERVERVKVAVWKAWRENEVKAKEQATIMETDSQSQDATPIVPPEEVDRTFTAEGKQTEMEVESESEPRPAVPAAVVIPVAESEPTPASENQMDVDTSDPHAAEPASPSTMSHEETSTPTAEESSSSHSHPLETESTAPPSLVDTHSEPEDSDGLLRTPEQAHSQLQTEPAVQSESDTQDTPMEDAQPEAHLQPAPEDQMKQQPMTAELMSSLFPLFSQDWDDVDS